jgi:hypothetical protein
MLVHSQKFELRESNFDDKKEKRRDAKRVRNWILQFLPVIAIGSIPYIYRRAAFQHRAIPTHLPLD